MSRHGIDTIAILTWPRTGSRYLCLLLGQHPQISAYHEIFRRDRAVVDAPPDFDAQLAFDCVPNDLRTWVNDHPQTYLKRLRQSTGEDIFSFKVFPGQLDRKVLAQEILRDSSCLKIFLSRCPLDSYVSLEKALILDAFGDVDSTSVRVELRAERFRAWWREVASWLQWCREGLVGDQPVIELSYENLIGPARTEDRMSNLVSQLSGAGLTLTDSPSNIRPLSTRQDRSTTLHQKLANYRQACEDLADLGLLPLAGTHRAAIEATLNAG